MPAKREDITDEGVTRLASYGCTQQEIADFFGCSLSSIKHRFAPAWTLGRAKVQRNVRVWQMRNARKGSDAMLIHLGKHYCGQTEKQDVNTTQTVKVIAVPSNGRERDDPAPGGAAMEPAIQ